MIGEADIAGVYVPSALVWGAIAFICTLTLQRILLATTFYRLVWHRALFDVALFAVLLGCVTGIGASLLTP